jgi:hypothetical protein
MVQCRGTKFFKKHTRHPRILGARSMTWSKLHNESPQILGSTVHNSVAMASWCVGFFHPWHSDHVWFAARIHPHDIYCLPKPTGHVKCELILCPSDSRIMSVSLCVWNFLTLPVFTPLNFPIESVQLSWLFSAPELLTESVICVCVCVCVCVLVSKL